MDLKRLFKTTFLCYCLIQVCEFFECKTNNLLGWRCEDDIKNGQLCFKRNKFDNKIVINCKEGYVIGHTNQVCDNFTMETWSWDLIDTYVCVKVEETLAQEQVTRVTPPVVSVTEIEQTTEVEETLTQEQVTRVTEIEHTSEEASDSFIWYITVGGLSTLLLVAVIIILGLLWRQKNCKPEGNADRQDETKPLKDATIKFNTTKEVFIAVDGGSCTK
ncbi:hypothetical protein ACF0H5_008055 [Mactra antiquata]